MEKGRGLTNAERPSLSHTDRHTYTDMLPTAPQRYGFLIAPSKSCAARSAQQQPHSLDVYGTAATPSLRPLTHLRADTQAETVAAGPRAAAPKRGPRFQPDLLYPKLACRRRSAACAVPEGCTRGWERGPS